MTRRPEAAADSSLHAALERFGRAGNVLVAVDFDGVLAEIVEERGAARALPASAEALQRLSRAEDTHVALVSGRTLDDLVALARPAASMAVIASHGAEVAGLPLQLDATQTRLRENVIADLESISGRFAGTDVEVKPVGAVLHTRLAERQVALAATGAALLGPARLPGAHAVVGKEMVEILVTTRTKGDAVIFLRDQFHPDATLYLGDDVTDEDAFVALGPGDVGVKVGPGPTAAQYRVPDPQAVARLLTALAEARDPGPAGQAKQVRPTDP